MDIYRIDREEGPARRAVRGWLAGLEGLPGALAEEVVTAWVTTWSASPYGALEEMPYSTHAPRYRLMDHVNEVTRAGIDLMRRAEAEWGWRLDPAVMLPILILHDVDKPLMYVRQEGAVRASVLSQEIPHGVVGAMLLKELGFAHRIVATVATHATNAPFHGSTQEAFLLHYADLFSTDHAIMEGGGKPFYQRHWA
jgi:hypothetical protein